MIFPKNCTFSSQHSIVHVEDSFEHLAILFPPKLLNSSHIYKWPKTYFLQKVLLDSKKAFLSDLPNPFLRKVTIVYRSMSGKNNESLSWPKKHFCSSRSPGDIELSYQELVDRVLQKVLQDIYSNSEKVDKSMNFQKIREEFFLDK